MSHSQNNMFSKARQDVDFYNQGGILLGKTNIERDIAAQPQFYFTFPGLKELEDETAFKCVALFPC